MRADVRKVAARNRSSLINHAQIPIQEDTGAVSVAKDSTGRIGIRVGVHLSHLVFGHAKVGGDGLDVARSYVYNRVPAAIGAGRAIRARRNLVGKNMKWPYGKMPGGDVPSEIKVLRLLGFSPAPYFGQIRDHSGRIASMVEVRRLTSDDAAQLWQLRLTALESEPQAFRETAAEHRHKPVTYFSERLGETRSDGFVYGAFDGEALIGMAGYYRKDEKRAWIWGVFVSPQYRGAGISQALLEALLDEIRSVPRIRSVHLTVALTQEPARRLYRKCGFRLSGPDLDTPPNEEHLTYLLEK